MTQNMPSDALCGDLSHERGTSAVAGSAWLDGLPGVQPPCRPWAGPEKHHQREAARSLARIGNEPNPWDWITARCGTPTCTTAEHLAIQAPIRLAYPHGLCIYCGRQGFTRDHLLPRNWTGDVRRRYVVTVPACGTCNTLLRDTLTVSITERRAIAHERLRRHYAKVLRTKDFTPQELREFGPTLRQHIADSLAKKAEVLRLFDWPTDPAYDARALQRSGIQDPWAVGLIVLDDPELAARVEALA